MSDERDDDGPEADHDETQRLIAFADKLRREKADSSLYRVIMAWADERATSAIKELIACDPTDTAAVRRLQIEAGLFDEFEALIDKTIEAGAEAERALSHPEQTD